MATNKMKIDKTGIEKEILKELENELQNDPLNAHGRGGKKKAISPLYEPNHHDQARAFREYTQGRIKYISSIDKFAAYNSTKGIYHIGEPALSSVWHVIARLAKARLESLELLDRDEQDNAISFAKKMLTGQEGNHIKKLLKEKELSCLLEEFDSDPLLINCQGIAVNLETGQNRLATRDDRFLKTAGFRPEKMETPVFDKFMKWATMGRDDLAAWLMRFFGYCLTGITTYELFANFHGSGRNGKGTLVHLMQRIMGDYQLELPLSAIVLEHNESKRAFDLADLPGKRMAAVSDVPKNTRYNIQNIKNMTGNDLLKSEQKYQAAYLFHNTAKLIVCSNNEIKLPSLGPDMRDRVRLIPFDNYIEREKQDRKLFKNLLEEAPGILHRLIQEAVFCVRGVDFPKCDVIEQATEKYFDKQDTVKMFCIDCIEQFPGGKIQAGELYAKYESWCKNSNYAFKSSRVFGEEFSQKYERKKAANGIFYQNIRIKEI